MNCIKNLLYLTIHGTFGDIVSGPLNTSTQKNPTHTFSSPGTYTVKLNIVNGSCTKDTSSCIYSVTTTIKVLSIKAKIDGTTTLCAGETTTLTASGGKAYLWNTGDTTATISRSFLTDTTYSVIVSESACQDTAKVSIKVKSTPLANAGNDTTICFNNSLHSWPMEE